MGKVQVLLLTLLVASLTGHENYNLRITAGSLPLRGLEPPAELVEDLARAGASWRSQVAAERSCAAKGW